MFHWLKHLSILQHFGFPSLTSNHSLSSITNITKGREGEIIGNGKGGRGERGEGVVVGVDKEGRIEEKIEEMRGEEKKRGRGKKWRRRENRRGGVRRGN
jgi:hypothetical protein